MKKFILIAVLLSTSCLVTTKEVHNHVYQPSGEVTFETHVQGSEAEDSLNGNDLTPTASLSVPLLP